MFRKLFLSYSGLIRHLHLKSVEPQELVSGFFYFDATREHVMSQGLDPMNVYSYITHDADELQGIVNVIRHAVLSAESEGRIVWRVGHESRSMTKLNAMLEKHRVRRIAAGHSNSLVNYMVRELVKKQGQLLDVIY